MKSRRATPRIWDTDWLVLRNLASALRQQATAHVRPHAVMVDLGCGEMPYAEMMRSIRIDYRGADIGSDAPLTIDADGQVAMADGTADAVLSVQVLEHVRNLDAYCGEITRLLNDQGVLLLSTHGTWLYHPHPEDHRRWTRTGLIVDLADRGLTVEEVQAIVGPLATTTLIRLTGFAFFLRSIPGLGPFLASAITVVMNLRALLEDAITPKQIREDNACVFLVRARKAA